jgi:cytosine/adenosine deaminase-related metal-dependent hydrolase
MCDFILKNGVVITMDPERRIIADGAVAVQGERIVAVGPTDEVLANCKSEKVIDASRKVIMPGLIDGHAHAGHALVKSLGADRGDAWQEACYHIYQRGSDEAFWYAEAQLSALERIKCGTTTSVNLLGGGDNVMRTDAASFGQAHCEAVQKAGIREFLAVGPGRLPFPKRFARWSGNLSRDVLISWEQQLKVCEDLIYTWHRAGDGRISICLTLPVYSSADGLSASEFDNLQQMAHQTYALSQQYQLLFIQDGHKKGTIQFTHEKFGLLGPRSIFAHCIDLTAQEIDLCRQTDTRIVHNPSAIYSILGRCPVPELLDAGVTVFLGSDGVAPDRSYDMFRHMFQCMRYHRTYYRDPDVLPAGKVLEMVTIDAARGLGMEQEIGSLEVGKLADIILIDLYQPHLYPMNMPAYRVAYYASGADVDTVIVGGKFLMEKRVVNTLDETETLDLAESALEKALQRTGLGYLQSLPEHFWGHSRL